MPRITCHPPQQPEAEIVASMRPGRNAPDNFSGSTSDQSAAAASMRPGRNAPDNTRRVVTEDGDHRASMRPGRNAPDNRRSVMPFIALEQLQ